MPNYKLASGARVPRVTEIIGILAKPQLIHWAWELGCQGLDYRKVRADAGDIGTLAHYLIMCHLKGITPSTKDYSREKIDKAETCFLKFLDWERRNPFKPLLVEQPLVSERYKFGGTIDCLGSFPNPGYEDSVDLLDFKTGKAIYAESAWQLAGYRLLLQEKGYQVRQHRILRIGRDETEGTEEKILTRVLLAREIFLTCLTLYQLMKEER